MNGPVEQRPKGDGFQEPGQIGEAGATVYCTGRGVRGTPSSYNRPETIEETAELVTARGGIGIAVATDHTVEGEVDGLMARGGREQSQLDLLVNSIAGEAPGFAWNKPFFEVTLAETEAAFRHAVCRTRSRRALPCHCFGRVVVR